MSGIKIINKKTRAHAFFTVQEALLSGALSNSQAMVASLTGAFSFASSFYLQTIVLAVTFPLRSRFSLSAAPVLSSLSHAA